MHFTPGNPAESILGPYATQEEVAQLESKMGLDKPFLVQMGNYLSKVFLHLDFGESYTTHLPIIQELGPRIPRTVVVASFSILLALVIGIPLGVASATHQGSIWDQVSMLISLVAVSMPGFWFGLILVIVFSVKLGWLPSSGIGGVEYYILPCIANCAGGLAQVARQTRSSMLETIRSDYITTARAKGLSPFEVTYKHALPNALIPVVTCIGTVFARQLGGTVVIERVFAIPGVGTYIIDAVNARNYPVVEASVILLAIAFAFVMLLVDLIYAAIDPRIRAQYRSNRKR
jgi:peptide/nickel transport system permease protein